MAGRRAALLVAVDSYENEGLKRLPAAAQDADALATVLSDPEIGDFDVDVLRNAAAHEILARIDEFFSVAEPPDLLLLHFSCHGVKDPSGELYLAARNTTPTRLGSTAVDTVAVNRFMRRSPARRIVLFLDCCYGGAFERGLIPRAGDYLDATSAFRDGGDEGNQGRGLAVITASSSVEYAFEGVDLAEIGRPQPSVFTGALVEGIATGAADRDRDGRISLSELYDHVYERVRATTAAQTPSKWEFGLQGDLVVARNPNPKISPEPLLAELQEGMNHALQPVRMAIVAQLKDIAHGTHLARAESARAGLAHMAADDSRLVSSAATEALAGVALACSPEAVDLGTSSVGVEAPGVEVTLTGPPIARAVRAKAVGPGIRVRRRGDVIVVTPDTAAPVEIQGSVVIVGPLGETTLPVRGLVVGDGRRAGASEAKGVQGGSRRAWPDAVPSPTEKGRDTPVPQDGHPESGTVAPLHAVTAGWPGPVRGLAAAAALAVVVGGALLGVTGGADLTDARRAHDLGEGLAAASDLSAALDKELWAVVEGLPATTRDSAARSTNSAVGAFTTWSAGVGGLSDATKARAEGLGERLAKLTDVRRTARPPRARNVLAAGFLPIQQQVRALVDDLAGELLVSDVGGEVVPHTLAAAALERARQAAFDERDLLSVTMRERKISATGYRNAQRLSERQESELATARSAVDDNIRDDVEELITTRARMDAFRDYATDVFGSSDGNPPGDVAAFKTFAGSRIDEMAALGSAARLKVQRPPRSAAPWAYVRLGLGVTLAALSAALLLGLALARTRRGTSLHRTLMASRQPPPRGSPIRHHPSSRSLSPRRAPAADRRAGARRRRRDDGVDAGGHGVGEVRGAP